MLVHPCLCRFCCHRTDLAHKFDSPLLFANCAALGMLQAAFNALWATAVASKPLMPHSMLSTSGCMGMSRWQTMTHLKLAGLCPKPCTHVLQPCGHPCPKLCYQECGLCSHPIPHLMLPCGHIANDLPCHRCFSHLCITLCPASARTPTQGIQDTHKYALPGSCMHRGP